MKILLLHTDFVEWEPKKKAIKTAEKAEKKPVKVKEALVALTAVEAGDEKKPLKLAGKAAEEILSVYKQVGAKNVVLYPYVHLSQQPAKPDVALKVLKEVEKLVKAGKVPVKRAPFGWYKAFDLKCKGHPLAELSRDISPGAGREVSDALKKEQTLKSHWYIMEPTGRMHSLKLQKDKILGYDFTGKASLEAFAKHEIAKSREVKQQPPHIKLMKHLGISGYEPGSDPGNLRYPPKGKMIKALLEDWVTQKVLDYGALEVETPIMYDYEHPSLKAYMHRFPARQYTIETPNKRVFLRFSACFGQFLMAHDAGISYRNLPLKLYELTRYSFRVEQRGELAGLRRLRAFTMPDCHALCADLDQAKEEMLIRFDLAKETLDGAGITLKDDLEVAIRMVKDFSKRNKEFVLKLAKKIGKPLLVEMWDKQFFYFVMKYDWNFVDNLSKAAALATDQIDVENAKNYDLLYTDRDNKKKHPIILHLSPSGAIERVIYALLEKEYRNHLEGRNPLLPMWLSPTQVRLSPVNEGFIKDCKRIADQLEKENIRADIDDRVEAVGKKIRDAEVEWVPLNIVFGDKEKKSGRLAVRFRETGKVKPMSLKEIVKLIKKETEGKPYRPVPMPRLLTKRAVFV